MCIALVGNTIFARLLTIVKFIDAWLLWIDILPVIHFSFFFFSRHECVVLKLMNEDVPVSFDSFVIIRIISSHIFFANAQQGSEQ